MVGFQITTPIYYFKIKEKMKLFSSDEDFLFALKRFNALTPVWDWCPTTSRKVHEDIFGVQINVREIYFKKQAGPGFSDIEKLSRTSMEKFLYLSVTQVPMVMRIADALIVEQQKELIEVVKRMDTKNSQAST